MHDALALEMLGQRFSASVVLLRRRLVCLWLGIVTPIRSDPRQVLTLRLLAAPARPPRTAPVDPPIIAHSCGSAWRPITRAALLRSCGARRTRDPVVPSDPEPSFARPLDLPGDVVSRWPRK